MKKLYKISDDANNACRDILEDIVNYVTGSLKVSINIYEVKPKSLIGVWCRDTSLGPGWRSCLLRYACKNTHDIKYVCIKY